MMTAIEDCVMHILMIINEFTNNIYRIDFVAYDRSPPYSCFGRMKLRAPAQRAQRACTTDGDANITDNYWNFTEFNGNTHIWVFYVPIYG
jgi:hypothetical protein